MNLKPGILNKNLTTGNPQLLTLIQILFNYHCLNLLTHTLANKQL